MEQKKVIISVKDEGPLKGFQSKDALEVATAKPPEEEQSEPLAALIDGEPTPKVDAGKEYAESMRNVKVRSRTYIPPFRYGKNTYTLPANKDVLVPLVVRRHLEEKGLL